MSAPPCGPEVRCRAESGRSPNAASGRNQRVVILRVGDERGAAEACELRPAVLPPTSGPGRQSRPCAHRSVPIEKARSADWPRLLAVGVLRVATTKGTTAPAPGGLGVVEADDEDGLRDFAAGHPVVISGTGNIEVGEILTEFVRPGGVA